MGLDIWFREDVERSLSSLERAAQHIEPGEFRRGWLAALGAVGLAFGLRPGTALTIPYEEVVVEGYELDRR